MDWGHVLAIVAFLIGFLGVAKAINILLRNVAELLKVWAESFEPDEDGQIRVTPEEVALISKEATDIMPALKDVGRAFKNIFKR